MSWQKAIILNPNEQVLHSWDGDCVRYHKAVENVALGLMHRTAQSKEIHNGTLVLTNQRMLWFEKRGIFSKTQRASFEIDLENLLGITSGGTISKWVSITDNQTEYIFHLRGVGKKEIEPFRDMILRQVEKLKEAPTVQREVITKEVVMLPCEYCNGLMPQTSTFCPNCGAKRKG
jgi:hypothetical protein